jgi:CheY-like chemotaxis protein
MGSAGAVERPSPSTAKIPVMVATVIDAEYRALDAGAAAFLLKPVVRDQLFATLRQISQHLAPGETAGIEPFVPGDGRAPSILLAEDNEANIQTFTAYLSAKGFNVDVARNGLDAISHTKTEKPDLVIMDIQMPHMSGLEAIEHIRNDTDPAVRDVPIVAVTALAMPGDREICLEAGANDYLSKPVSLKRLVEAVQKHLRPAARNGDPVEK